MFKKFTDWFINGMIWGDFEFVNLRWKIKKIAYRCKLYKTNDVIEKECLDKALNKYKKY